MRPPSPKLVKAEVMALRVHFYERELTDHEAKRLLADWIVACSKVPADLFVLACMKWKMEPLKDGFPAPGILFRLIKDDLLERRKMYSRTRAMVKWLNDNPKREPSVKHSKAYKSKMKAKVDGVIRDAVKKMPKTDQVEIENRRQRERQRQLRQLGHSIQDERKAG